MNYRLDTNGNVVREKDGGPMTMSIVAGIAYCSGKINKFTRKYDSAKDLESDVLCPVLESCRPRVELGKCFDPQNKTGWEGCPIYDHLKPKETRKGLVA